MFLCGIDVGTTACKAAVFDLEGHMKGYGFGEYGILYPAPGWAEQNVEEVWHTVKYVMKQAISQSGITNIAALSLSVQGDAVIPVDEHINPLHHAVLGMDYRTVNQVDECSRLIGDRRLFDVTGMRPHPMNSLTKIMWFKEERPEIYNKAYKFMTYADYVMCKLGASPIIDHTMASRTMAFDISTKQWSDEILTALEIDKGLLSEAVSSGKAIGYIKPELAYEMGISSDVLLVSGGHDQTCAALGAGAVKEGIAVDSHGTAEVLSMALSRPLLNDTMYNGFYPCYCYAKNEMYFTFSLNHTGGILLKWYKDNFAYPEVAEAKKKGCDPYDIITAMMPEEPSAVMVLPHFNGSGTPQCDLKSKGAIIGLTMSTTRHDISKAILEALAFELRVNIEYMSQAGMFINEIRAVGGGAKSPRGLQLKADIVKQNICTLKIREAACLGAAILAGSACGAYRSVDEGVERAVAVNEVYTPNYGACNIYDKRYNIYKDLYHTLKNINRQL